MKITTAFKSALYLVLFLSMGLIMQAQYTIKGNVYDELGSTVSFASVTLVDALSNKTVAFKNTDGNGDYVLKFANPGEYIIKVRNLKYETYEENIIITESQKTYEKDINLFSKDGQLDTIIAKGKESVASISGDTITFKIERFTDDTERNLGDIIDKLPGMEIDESGNIKANGENVDKLLVDGEEFYSDTQKMATENLNAKAVKDIQLLTDYKEDGKLDEMDGDKKTAVNVQLKEEYKNKITGDALLGSGYESKYDFHTNLFKFNTKGNISFIGDVQNTGESVFSFTEYMAFVGGFSEFASAGRGQRFSFSFDNNSIFSLINASNNVEKRNNQVGAININQSLNEKWKLNLTTVLSGTQQNSFSEQNRDYYNGWNERVVTNQDNNSFFTSNKLKLKYQVSDSALVTYKMNLNFSNNEDENGINNILNGNAQNFQDDNSTNPWNVSQRLTYEFKPSKRTLMEIGGSYSHQVNPDRNEVISQNPYLGLPSNADNYYNTIYDLDKKTQEALAFTSFKYSRKKRIYKGEIGAKWSKYKMESLWRDVRTGEALQAENYAYDFIYENSEIYGELSVAKNKDFWQYELGTVVKYYWLQDDYSEDFDRLAWYPFANISANFSTASVLTFDYSYSENFPNAENYIPIGERIIQSYRNVQIANDNINFTNYFPQNRFNLRYRYFDQFSGFYLNASTSYTLSDGSVSSRSTFNPEGFNEVDQLIAPESTTWSNFMYVGNKFKLGTPLQVRAGANYTHSDGYSFVNEFVSSVSDRYGIDISLKTDWDSKFNMEIGFEYSENKTEIESDIAPNQLFISRSPYIELRGALEKSGINWNTRYTHSDAQGIQLDLWDLEFTYSRPKSTWEFGVIGRNLLNFNNQEQVNVSSNSLYLVENRYLILPGFAMLTAKHTF